MDRELDQELIKKFQHLHKTKKGRPKNIFGYDVKEWRGAGGAEGSPYLAYLSKKGNYNFENDMQEPVEANPDSLSEDEAIYRVKFNPDESIQYKKIMNALPKLTRRQKEVLSIIVYQNKSIRETAKYLGINKSVIIKMLNTIKKKIGE